MPKRIPDMITGETARKIKNMSVPDLNTYLFAIYTAGYSDGFSDRLQTPARVAGMQTEEAAPDG